MSGPFDWATPISVSGFTRNELWLGCFANGSDMTHGDLDDIIDGHRTASTREHAVLALTLNERFDDMDQNGRSLPYLD